jgi:hypothetical protein
MLWVAGGLTIFVLFFFGTLFIFDLFSSSRANNRLRAEQVTLLSDALGKYHQARGVYPSFPDNPVDDLKKDLVDGGFLKAIPSDPARSSNRQQYRYAGGSQTYGILVMLEPEPFLVGTRNAVECVVGANIKGSGAWGDPPPCPF